MRNLDGRCYRITGSSQSLPRELILEDGPGRRYLYSSATNTLSPPALSPALEVALGSGQHGYARWRPIVDGEWVDAEAFQEIATIEVGRPTRSSADVPDNG